MITQTAVDVPALLDQQKVGWFQFRLLGVCALVVMLDGFDIQSIGYVAPAVAQDLHLSYAQLSPVFASGLLGLTIGALICGPLADWFGRRILIIVGTLFFAVFTLATAMVGSVNSLIFLRFVSGLGLGGVLPNTIALTSEFCPRRRHGTMVMVMNSGFPLGSALGGFAAAPIIPAYGWRSVFILGGILPLALVFPHKQSVLTILCIFFLLYEGRQYWLSVDPPVDRQAREWEEAVRRSFGYDDVLFTPEPSFEIPEQPPGQLARSRKRIYEFDAAQVAHLRLTIPAARLFLLGTAGAIDAHCPEKHTLSPSLYYCRL